MIKISPSILTADFSNISAVITELDNAGADYIHLDVMDGVFVPNITFGPLVVSAIRPYTEKPLDVHLMIENPIDYIEAFANSGADIITVHAESASGRHLNSLVQKIKLCGKKSGIALNPSTPIEFLDYMYEYIDLVLIMTVNPGFGGQKFINASYEKIRKTADKISSLGLNIELELDGGITADNCKQAISAGANVLVAGSSVFNGKNMKENITLLRG